MLKALQPNIEANTSNVVILLERESMILFLVIVVVNDGFFVRCKNGMYDGMYSVVLFCFV